MELLDLLGVQVDLNDTPTLDVVVDCRDGRWFRCWVPSTTTLGQLKDRLQREEAWPKDALLETDAKDCWDPNAGGFFGQKICETRRLCLRRSSQYCNFYGEYDEP